MKFFSSELGHEYAKTYTFGYCNYGVLEPDDKPSEMYERGYLPYSGSPESKGMFYMARSGRIYLPEFELNSECRRVAKKFDGKLTRKAIPFSEFKITEEFIDFWLEYFQRAHGSSVLKRERFMHWLNFGIISHIGVYRDKSGKVVAYTLEVSDETMTHDWYEGYAAELDKQSFGMWVMIDIARAAKERGAAYYYVGTVYGGSIGHSYKTNFPALEYWNGETWIKDKNNKQIRSHVKKDSERQISLIDEWKQNHPLF